MHTTPTPAELWEMAHRLSQRAADLTTGRVQEPHGMWPGQHGPDACAHLAAKFRIQAIVVVLHTQGLSRHGDTHIQAPHWLMLSPADDSTGVGVSSYQTQGEWSAPFEASLPGTVRAAREILAQAARACRLRNRSDFAAPCPQCARWAAELDTRKDRP